MRQPHVHKDGPGEDLGRKKRITREINENRRTISSRYTTACLVSIVSTWLTARDTREGAALRADKSVTIDLPIKKLACESLVSCHQSFLLFSSLSRFQPRIYMYIVVSLKMCVPCSKLMSSCHLERQGPHEKRSTRAEPFYLSRDKMLMKYQCYT